MRKSCVIPKCERVSRLRGLCSLHYQQQWKAERLDDYPREVRGAGRRRPRATVCPHTDREHCAKGLCQSCYNSRQIKVAPIRKKATLCEHTDRKHNGKGLCKSCYTRQWMRDHPDAPGTGNNWLRDHPIEARLHRRRAVLKKQHGITIEQYEEMWRKQEGKCGNPLCTFEAPMMVDDFRRGGLHVDHDHATGVIRGLLCPFCNAALGHAKDEITRLAGLIKYLGMNL